MASSGTKARDRSSPKHGYAVNKEQRPPRDVEREITQAAREYQVTAAVVDDTLSQLAATEDELARQGELLERLADKLGITAELQRLHALNERRARRLRNSLKAGAATGAGKRSQSRRPRRA